MRFLYIAMHRELFQDELLAELLPPLEPDGTSHLWEALGRHFTGMSYAEADLLSRKNKEFIRDLFPSGIDLRVAARPEAQAVIGKVGAQTRGVEKLLRRIGFRYADRIDPFDGGPHFIAEADEITLIASTRRVRVASALAAGTAAHRSDCRPRPPRTCSLSRSARRRSPSRARTRCRSARPRSSSSRRSRETSSSAFR